MPYGPWTNHVLEWWKHKDDPNVLFLKYEDLKKVITSAKKNASFIIFCLNGLKVEMEMEVS